MARRIHLLTVRPSGTFTLCGKRLDPTQPPRDLLVVDEFGPEVDCKLCRYRVETATLPTGERAAELARPAIRAAAGLVATRQLRELHPDEWAGLYIAALPAVEARLLPRYVASVERNRARGGR